MVKTLKLIDGYYGVTPIRKVRDDKYTYEISNKDKFGGKSNYKYKGEYIYRGKTKDGYSIYDRYDDEKENKK